VTFNYDDVGNRPSVVDGATVSYTADSMNQYSAVGGVPLLGYDDNGNLTDDGMYDYVYNKENQLTEIKDGVPTVATYEYDLLGRRIKKTVGGVVTKYAWAGSSIVAEYNGSDVLQRRFVYAGLDQPVVMITAADEYYYYHYDALGSVIAMTEASVKRLGF